MSEITRAQADFITAQERLTVAAEERAKATELYLAAESAFRDAWDALSGSERRAVNAIYEFDRGVVA